MSTVQLGGEQRLLLHNMSWQSYENFLKEFDERPTVRLTYDRGNLEIITLGLEHQSYNYFLGRLVEALTDELEVDIKGGRSTTFKREDLERGLEPDECYWIQNEPRMRGKREFDPLLDPPPDLVLEIDITSSSINRIKIYEAMKVPEVWQFNGESLRVYQLGPNGKYKLCERSRLFPSLPLAEVMPFLRASDTQSESKVLRSFRAWVREYILPTWKGIGRRAAPSRKTPQPRKKQDTNGPSR
jgi:Uma2 family endonuclease